MVKLIESKEEYDKLVADAGDRLIIIDFYATWCGPCKMMGPKFDKMAEEFPDCIFIKIDVDEAATEEVVDESDVKVMPTFVLLKNGKEVAHLEGNVPDKLREAVETNK